MTNRISVPSGFSCIRTAEHYLAFASLKCMHKMFAKRKCREMIVWLNESVCVCARVGMCVSQWMAMISFTCIGIVSTRPNYVHVCVYARSMECLCSSSTQFERQWVRFIPSNSIEFGWSCCRASIRMNSTDHELISMNCLQDVVRIFFWMI